MKRSFVKMQGCGNDYIYFDCLKEDFPDPEKWSIPLSDRHFGIGGDGIVLICPSQIADAKMRMFNADGSEGKMCGNAIRCVGKYLYDYGIVNKEEITVETLSGLKHLFLSIKNGKVDSVRVNMGKADLTASAIPVFGEKSQVIGEPFDILDQKYRITCVSMGNPHCVVFVPELDLDLERIGPEFEHHPKFPERINTEFVQYLDSHTLSMRVWERGSGETWACGTGACAAVVAACENGYCPKNEDILIHLKGGDLRIRYTDEAVWMTGPAAVSFTGEVLLDEIHTQEG
jgi:diaminopimelate epimerase